MFTAGLLIAAFVSIPIVNLATPLFGMAMMVHLHKKLSGRRPSEIGMRRADALPQQGEVSSVADLSGLHQRVDQFRGAWADAS